MLEYVVRQSLSIDSNSMGNLLNGFQNMHLFGFELLLVMLF